METLNFTQWMVTIAIAAVVPLFSRRYLPAYFTKKGENLASKEDLEHLTRLVEVVRTQYAGEIERLKASLLSEGQVLERRRRVYEEVCTSLRVFIEGHTTSPEAKNGFHAAYAAAWLWASDDVLKPLNRFIEMKIQQSASPVSVDQANLKLAYSEIIVAMRRDVGFPSTQVPQADYKFIKF